MEIIKSNDAGFMKILQRHPNVVIKYHSEIACPVCVTLLPVYIRLSQKAEYSEITFVRMDADENPVAQKLIKDNKLPFLAVYKGGLLVECGTVKSGKEIEDMINNLLNTKINL